MILTFFGHSDFVRTDEYEQKLLAVLEERVGDSPADMYLGGYGNFDSFALDCCKKYKRTHPDIKLVFVTPYLDSRLDEITKLKLYDETIYPPLEHVPKRFAIIKRNEFMVDSADISICYVRHEYGGAYKAYTYARRKNKPLINISKNTVV